MTRIHETSGTRLGNMESNENAVATSRNQIDNLGKIWGNRKPKRRGECMTIQETSRRTPRKVTEHLEII